VNIGADVPHGTEEAQLVHQPQGGRADDETGALIVEDAFSSFQDNKVDSGFGQGVCSRQTAGAAPDDDDFEVTSAGHDPVSVRECCSNELRIYSV
jgi:hypothetical protein